MAEANSQVNDTPCGQIEYIEGGSGAPVLAVHGVGGGFDQGLPMVEDFLGDGFLYIVPSRFGYLRTPLPGDALPASQADTYVCLLDALGLQWISVMKMSVGVFEPRSTQSLT